MYFSWYCLACLTGIALLAMIANSGWFLGYAVIILILLWALDGFLTIKKISLNAARHFTVPLYQNQKNQVELVFNNLSRYQIHVSWKDEPPFAVRAAYPQGRLILAARESVTVSYEILPPKRGRFDFGGLNFRFNGPLRLFSQRIKCSLAEELLVYPDLTAIGSGKLLQLAPSELEGLQRHNRFGMGGELVQLREFVVGDDYRKINWKVSAHYGKPIVNEYEPEKDQSVFLLFDAGRLLFDQIDSENNRFDHVLDSAIQLAYQVLTRGDLIGALSFHYKVDRFLPAGKGRSQLQQFIRAFYDQQALMVESDYREAFNFWQNKVNKRSLLFVYTDLLDQESSRELCDQLRIISRHHLVVCVLARHDQLLETLERPISDEKSAYLKGVALEMWEERENLKKKLAGNNIRILETTPANIRRMVVDHYLFLKKRGSF